MKYPILFTKVFSEPWMIIPAVHYSIQSLLISRINGDAVEMESPAFAPHVNLAYELNVDTPRNDEKEYLKVGSVALIAVNGIIGSHLSKLETMCGGESIERLHRALSTAEQDDGVSRIVFCFHSPGGTSTGLVELADRIRDCAKPTLAFTDSIMGSAAYFLASCCDEIYVTRSSSTGSIGVYIALLDKTVAMEKAGLKLELFKAGDHKGMGLPGNPLTDDGRALLQQKVDRGYEGFKQVVRSKRPAVPDSAMQGQTFEGESAVENNLADGIVSGLQELLNLIELMDR